MASPEITLANFVGIIASGSYRSTASKSRAFDVAKVLGNGFVISPEAGLILTCEHVLPKQDRDSSAKFAFFMYDESMSVRVFPIDCSRAVQWKSNDVIALPITNYSGLNSYPLNTAALPLATQVMTIGYPLNHLSSTPNNNVITPRALVSHIVSGYQDEYETDKPFIVTMSGSPVLLGAEIVGIATMNREYAINQYLTEKVETLHGDTLLTRERYEYSEVARFGVFSKAASWHSWITEIVR